MKLLSIASASLLFASVSAFAAEPYGTSSSYSNSGATTGSAIMPRINATGGVSQARINTGGNPDWKTNGAATLTGDFGIFNSPVVLELGGSYRNLGVNGIGDTNVNLHYLGVPVLAKLYIGDPMTTAFFVRAGVRPQWAVSKQAEVAGAAVDDNGLKSFDLPGVAGIGVKIGIAPQYSLILSADYEKSILNINDVQGAGDLRNEAMVFQGGLSVNL